MTGAPARAVLAIVAVAALLVCGATVAQAHEGRTVMPVEATVAPMEPAPPAPGDVGPGHTISRAPSATVVPLALVAMVALGITLTLARAPRRAVALAVVALIVLVLFEAGVHGVHHLGDPRAAGQCSVAVTAEHVTGATSDVPATVTPLLIVSASVALPDSPFPAGRDRRPGDSRAPPARSA